MTTSARLHLCAASALAMISSTSVYCSDVVVQPSAGSGFVIQDSGGSQVRLRVDENGQIVMPVLVNGAQQNLPVCVGSGGQIGPCAPGAIGGSVGPQGPTGPAGPTGAQGPKGDPGDGTFTIPFHGSGSDPNSAFSAGNTSAGSGVKGATQDTSGFSGVAGVWGDSGSNYGVWGSSSIQDGVHGDSQSSSGVAGYSQTGTGVWGGTANGNVGVYGLAQIGSGLTGAAGIWGDSASNYGVWGSSTSQDGVHGDSQNLSGVAGYSQTGTGVWGGSAGAGNGLYGSSQTGTGVYGHSSASFGMGTDGPAQQARNQGGWVKAMAHVNPGSTNTSPSIDRCFNSQLPLPAANTPPCGLNVSYLAQGQVFVDFGFEIDDRFVFLSAAAGGVSASACLRSETQICGSTNISPSTAEVETYNANDNLGLTNAPFTIVVF